MVKDQDPIKLLTGADSCTRCDHKSCGTGKRDGQSATSGRLVWSLWSGRSEVFHNVRDEIDRKN